MDTKSIEKKPYADIDEFENYKSVQVFKSKIGRPGTFKRYRYNLRDFMRFVNKQPGYETHTPDTLIEEAKAMSRQELYDLVDLLILYRKSQENRGLRAKSIKTRVATAKSFFKHNRADLPSDETIWKVAPDTPPVTGELTPQDIKEMILSMNTTYQAIYTSMYQSGMDLDCFMRWNREGWSSLNETLRRGDDIHEIEVHGRKKTRNIETFYTYIGRDALDKIRTYVEQERPEKGDAIFYTRTGKPVTKNSVYLMWLRHLKSLGKIHSKDNGKANRYGMNPHELRDVFVTQFQKSPAGEPAGQYFTGHVGDSNKYAKAFKDRDYRVKKYKEGEPWLSLFSDSVSLGLVRAEEYEERIRIQNAQIEAMRRELAEIKQSFTTPDPSALADAFNLMMLEADPERVKATFPPEYIERILRIKEARK